MAAIQVRDVPEDVHEELKARARLEGKSLNTLLLEELRQIARRGRNAEVFERSRNSPWAKKLSALDATRMIRAVRDAADDAG